MRDPFIGDPYWARSQKEIGANFARRSDHQHDHQAVNNHRPSGSARVRGPNLSGCCHRPRSLAPSIGAAGCSRECGRTLWNERDRTESVKLANSLRGPHLEELVDDGFRKLLTHDRHRSIRRRATRGVTCARAPRRRCSPGRRRGVDALGPHRLWPQSTRASESSHICDRRGTPPR
jgi:hypothetical protein